MRLSANAAAGKRLKSALVGCEKFFLTAGLIALSICGATLLYSILLSAYDNWAFDQSLHGQHRIERAGGDPSMLLAAPASARSRRNANVAAKAGAPKSGTAKTRPRGARLARLQIPSVGLSVMVLDGTQEWILQRGAGHIEGTAYPGEPGNVAIAGHRDRSFRKLKNVGKNDWIVLQTPGRTYRYRVEDISIVKPNDVSVLKPTTEPSLTLVTCYPFYYIGHAPQRYIIKAQLVRAESVAD